MLRLSERARRNVVPADVAGSEHFAIDSAGLEDLGSDDAVLSGGGWSQAFGSPHATLRLRAHFSALERLRRMLRRPIGWLLLAACLAAAPSADAQSTLTSPGARIFPVAGGGSAAPRDGLIATDADFSYLDAAALPDGTVALTDRRGVYSVTSDGMLHALPAIRADGRPIRMALVGGAADGALLGMPFRAKTVYVLRPGAVSWMPLVSTKLIPNWQVAEFYDVLGTARSVIAATSEGVWRLPLDGSPAVRLRPETQDDVENLASQQLAGFPDGTVAFTYSDLDEIAVAAPSGATRTLTLPAQGGDQSRIGLTALQDGTLARVAGSVDLIGLDGTFRARLGRRPALGTGDGGSPAQAFLGGFELAAAGNALVVAQDLQIGIEHAPFDLGARQLRNGALSFPMPRRWYPHYVLRMIVPGIPGRALAALAPGTYAALPRGRVAYGATFAGHAQVTVRKQGKLVASAQADVPVGDGEIALSSIPPVGNLRVHLDIRGADGERSTSRMTVVTRKRLRLDRARRLLRSIPRNAANLGFPLVVDARRFGRCERRSAIEVSCTAYTTYVGGPAQRTCKRIVTARLRPDGVRGWIERGRGDCRTVRPPS